jgi:hypothetical protein
MCTKIPNYCTENNGIRLKVRPHRKRAAAVDCDLVMPERGSPPRTAISGDASLASPDIALTGQFCSYRRHSDSGIFKNSALYREYIDGKTILPPKPLPGTIIPVPHVLIADEGFALDVFNAPFPKSCDR